MKNQLSKLLVLLIFCGTSLVAQSQSKEQRIKSFFAGFENKDWDILANQVAEGFTFTSPNNDDHINLSAFKVKCWATGIKSFKTIEFQKIIVEGNTAFVMYNITTTDGKMIRNVEYYTFSNGKIKSIETFFGTGMDAYLHRSSKK